jgi:endonuclease III
MINRDIEIALKSQGCYTNRAKWIIRASKIGEH